MHTTLSSATKTVTIGHDQPFCIIGERINPTGRKAFAAQLRENDLSQVIVDVEAQVAAGAHVLDVNMGVPLTDEPDLLARAIRLVQEHTDLPICIDSSIVEALEAGLDAYQGKALVNSATGEDDRMDLILPLVKKYGAAVIILRERRDGHSRDRRAAPRDHAQDRPGRGREARHRDGGHRDRPARDADRRRSDDGHDDDHDDPRDPRRVRLRTCASARRTSASACPTATR